MSWFNFGGPGWFNDVFTLEITVNGDRLIDCHSLLFQEKCPLAASDELLCGNVKIIAPDGRSVSHYGVSMTLEWSVSFFETLATRETAVHQVTLVEPGTVTGEVAIPFEIDLKSLASQFLETYDGEMFCVRHALLVTVSRPWYTFDVVRSLAIAIQKIDAAPEVEEHLIDDDKTLRQRYLEDGKQLVEDENESRSHVLRVVDSVQGLVMHYDRSCLNLGDTFRGVIYLGGGVPEFLQGKIDPESQLDTVSQLEVVIYKIETGEEDSHEVIICVHTIDLNTMHQISDGASPEEASETAVSEQGVDLGDQTVLEFPVEIPIVKSENAVEFSPTIIDGPLSVRYFVRLVGKRDNTSVWNTHELVLFRSSLHTESI